jgi:hypothetical protein
MTEEQLAVALRHEDHHQGLRLCEEQCAFLHGYIERLADLDLGDASVDVAFQTVYLILHPTKGGYYRGAGGFPARGIYFSDFIGPRIPEYYRVPRTVR